uniref:Exostosin GT47 domain-containing protein n=1 Tax=Eutreptiella gymnastica TaxID=73025 RepID=A0A7S1N5S8_9EUGL
MFACHVPYALRNHPKVRILPLGLKAVNVPLVSNYRKQMGPLPWNFVFAQFSIRPPPIRSVPRTRLIRYLQANGLVPSTPMHRMKKPEYYKKLLASKFVVAPRGNAPDTFRAYESLALGRVPIVYKLIDPFVYEGLPVVQVSEWEEVNRSRLLAEWNALQQTTVNIRKLTHGWWLWYILLQVLDTD